MKKLMVMLAAVATAFGLFADEPATGGVIGTPTSLEEASPMETNLWSDASLGTVKNYEEEGITPYAYPADVKYRRYTGFGDNENFLRVTSTFTAPLYRWNEVSEDEPVPSAIVDGASVDTLVELVGVEDDEVPALASGAKLAVWLKATTADEVEAPETNLYVTAGFNDDGTITAKPYKITNISVEAGTWHRVTVKMLANCFETNLPGFVVYIDGVLAQVAQADYDYGDFTQTDGGSYSKKQALFAPAVNDNTFSGVGFAGNGNVDDISVTWGDQVPGFTAPAIEATIAADDVALTNFTYKIDNGAWISVAANGAYTFDIEEGQKVYFADDYKFRADETAAYAVTGITPSGFQKSGDGYEYSGAANPSLTINVEATDYVVVVRDGEGKFVKGYTDPNAAIADIDTPGFAGAITIPTEDGFAYRNGAKGTITFNQNDTITVDAQGIWLVTSADEIAVADVKAGADIRVVGDVDVSGTIAGKLTIVEGDCTVSDELEINNEGWVSAGDEGMLFAFGSFSLDDEVLITLGEHGLLQTVNKQTYQGAGSIFEEPEEGKKIKETEVKPEETVIGYQYTLVAETTGTVIFICEKNAFTNEVADQESTVKIVSIAPSAATVEGSTLYKFDGWFTDTACTEALDPEATVVPNTTTYIYAKALDPVTLTFTSTIGTAPQPVTVKVGEAWGTAPEMADAENIFNGWAQEGEVVAADFWTTPVEADDEVAAKWSPAGATAGGVAYATIKAALEAPASSNKTVKFLADLAQADAIAKVTTSAATIDFNGKNVAITELTYKGDAETFTVENGTNGQYKAKKITVPAGVNLTIQDMLCYSATTVMGGEGAVLTVTGCYFSDKYDQGGTEDGSSGNFASYCMQLDNSATLANNALFARADFVGNTFCQMCRAAIGSGNNVTTMFFYGNTFLGSKNCMASGETGERYAALQIAAANKIYIENNVYTNSALYPHSIPLDSLAGKDIGMVQGAVRVDDAKVGAMVLSGNEFQTGVYFFWDRRANTVTDNIFYGLNTATEDGFLWGKGVKKTTVEDVVPAYTPGTDPLALPEGVDSIYAWLHGANAEKPYVVNGTYYAELPTLAADDVIIVEPTLAKDFAITSETLALENVTVGDQVKANMFKVIEKPQAVTIAVSLQNVKSVTYDSQVKTENFVIADVAKGSTITISDIVADDQYEVSITCSKDITDNGDGTFTVAEELSNPNATIDFVGVASIAVAYTIADDTIVGHYGISNISDAWAMAKDGVHYVKMFDVWTKSTSDNDLVIDAVCRINNDGAYKLQMKATNEFPVASITRAANDKFDIYTPYTTLQAAVDAETNATPMLVTGAAVDLSELTLTVAKNTFQGRFGDAYGERFTGSFKAETEPVCQGVAKTSAWGAEGKTFAFVARAIDYTVTFDKNGADGGTKVDPIVFHYGDTKTAPECTWTYTGYKFVAWTNLVAGGAAFVAGDPLPTEVDADYTLTALWAANAPTPVPPGEDITPDPGDDANKINGDRQIKAKYLKAPGGVETTATYLDCFNAVAGEAAGTVKFVLNENGTNTVKAAEAVADTAALEQVLAATGDSTTLTLTDAQVLKGFYYSLKQGGEVQSIDFAQPSDANKLGGAVAITFTLQKPVNAGFYQMLITPKQVPVNKAESWLHQ